MWNTCQPFYAYALVTTSPAVLDSWQSQVPVCHSIFHIDSRHTQGAQIGIDIPPLLLLLLPYIEKFQDHTSTSILLSPSSWILYKEPKPSCFSWASSYNFLYHYFRPKLSTLAITHEQQQQLFSRRNRFMSSIIEHFPLTSHHILQRGWRYQFPRQ